mgnify:CR=1 FL=1
MARQATSNDKLKEALELLNEAAREKKDELKGLAGDKYSDLREALAGVEGKVAGSVQHAAERARELRERGEERVRETTHAVDERVHQEPWKAVGVAAGAALLLGFIMGRK